MRLSTLALEGSESDAAGAQAPAADRGAGSAALLRHVDLVLLALAAPVFVIADLPLLGYAVGAIAWLIQHAILVVAERRSGIALRAGDRTSAVGSIAVATFVRLWVVTGAILLVGLLAEREDGLAAAVLCAALVTAHLGGTALSRLFASEPGGTR